MFIKKILIPIFLFCFYSLGAQTNDTTFRKEWIDIDSTIIKKNLPKSALQKVNALYNKAKQQQLQVQIIKCLVYRMSLEDKVLDNKPNNAIALLQNEIADTKNDAVKSILYCLLANRYKQYFNNNRWRFYNRSTTVNFVKADIETWSADNFHEAIAQEIVPLLAEQANERVLALDLESLKPWDTDVDTSGKAALKPFNNGEELIDKSIKCFNKLSPFLGSRLEVMKANNLFDVDSRKGKAPGGYNYPLAETGAPFIFMNAANSFRDLTTMVHEGGHAIHTFVTADLELNDFKHCPSEVAELASMSMELISMDHWDVFFTDAEELKRAKRYQLRDILKTLPWVAVVDQFQHWIYTNPNHTTAERTEAWKQIFAKFGAGFVDWSDHETALENLWQKQLHIFEVPFYYIEYGIAQLGAIAVWKNYKENPEKGLHDYLEALKLGYTKSMKEIYQTAGISFDFSPGYIQELIDFVKAELRNLEE